MCSRAADSRDGYLLSVVVSFPFIVSGVTIPLLQYPNRNTLEYSPLGILLLLLYTTYGAGHMSSVAIGKDSSPKTRLVMVRIFRLLSVIGKWNQLMNDRQDSGS